MVTTLDLPAKDMPLDVPALRHAAVINSNNPRQPASTQWLYIKSCGYSSEEEAWQAARHLKDTFLIIGADGLGVDFGSDKATSWTSDVLKQKIKDELNTIIRDDVHGIDVFEDGPVRHITVSGQASVHFGVPNLIERLTAAMHHPPLTSALRTGLELINDSLFPMPNEASFLLRISAVEAMSEQAFKPASVQSLIDELIRVTPWLTGQKSASEAIRNLLSNARRQSVRQACLGKLRHRLGRATAKRFDHLYGLRSKYVHEGLGRGTFQQPTREAYDIARKLLDAEIKGLVSEPQNSNDVAEEREKRVLGKRVVLAWRVILGRAT